MRPHGKKTSIRYQGQWNNGAVETLFRAQTRR